MLNRTIFVYLLLVSIAVPPTQAVSGQQAPPSGQAASLILQGKSLLEEGLNQNDHGKILQARAIFERVTGDTEHAALAHYYVALSDYRMANLLLAENRRQTRTYLNSAIEHLNEAIDLDDQFAEAWALISSCYGLKIGLSPIQGMILGPKAGKAVERAREIAPENPRVVLIAAISDFSTPEAFGGSKEEALEGFERAVELFEQVVISDPLAPEWGHEETYAWMGILYTDAGDIEMAREAYEKALVINPEYGWIKYVLLPQLPPR